MFSGLVTAVATMGAVIYTNKKTREQLKKEEERHKAEKAEIEKASKYVVLKPAMLINTFSEIIERIILNNDYNRILLFSGKDGFGFYDDTYSFSNHRLRLLLIENVS